MTTRQPKDTTPHCPDCGWTGQRPATAAVAARALAVHSCDLHRRRTAAAARRLARLQEGGPEAPCTHAAGHHHGTYARYTLDKCRCRPCRDANRANAQRHTRERLYGRSRFVPAAPVRQHLLELRAQGMGRRTTAQLAGVSESVLCAILFGSSRRGPRKPSTRVLRTTAEKVLNVQLALADGAVVDGTGTVRRLRALAYIGWSTPRLAEQSAGQLADDRIRRVLAGHDTTAGTARAVARLYDALWDRPPTAVGRWQLASLTRTQTHARTAGWAPPLAWDDETIDDPTAEPQHRLGEQPGTGIDEAAVLRRLAGDRTLRITRAERWTVIQRLHATGLSDQEISHRVGVSDRQVLRDRQALGLPANYDAGRADVA